MKTLHLFSALSAPLRLNALRLSSAVKMPLFILCVLCVAVVNRICFCIFSANFPAIRRINISGRHTAATRGVCAISADRADLPRSHFCRFGGCSRASQLALQR